MSVLCWIAPQPVHAQRIHPQVLQPGNHQEVRGEVQGPRAVFGPTKKTVRSTSKAKASSAPKAKVRPVSKEANEAIASGHIQISMKTKVVAKWGEEHWPAMKYILDHESGSNAYAVNKSSGACGIPQALPCSKLLNVVGSLDNVEGQLDWMINYVANRYGNPIKAMEFHKVKNWY